jgi:hypothetical protein
MRVVVKVHRVARQDFDDWQRQLARPMGGGPELARFLLAELIRQLEASEGMPAEAEFLEDHDPPCWLWRFNADTWVLYKWKDRDHGFWRGVERKVLIIGLAHHRPGRTGP